MDPGTQGSNTIVWGQKGGEETHTLVTAEMPTHSHTPMASSGSPTYAASCSASGHQS